MQILRRPYLLVGFIVGVVMVLWLQNDFGIAEDAQEAKTQAVADKVEKKADQTEKAEGRNDLVRDEIKVKSDTTGEPVIEQVGEASWYGKGFHGKKTASGETFDQNDKTAAHPTLPLGSEATVTNLETGKSVDVEINDRGPYTRGRDIDLSKEAAKEIGMKEDGAAPVKIEAKVPPEKDETK